MHKELMTSVRGADKQPGKFRTIQNWIGTAGTPIEQATFVPPEPAVLPGYLSLFEEYIKADDSDILMQSAIVHAQFELLHPFLEGNGRIGRLLIPLFLYYKNVLSRPMFYLSTYLENKRNEYYQHLRGISQRSDWDAWLRFYLNAVTEQSIIAHIYEIDDSNDQTFIAMEYIEVRSLHEMLERPLPLDEAIEYATQIAAGLQAAHEKGVVHRDIKSANIMVTEKSQCKIMDFGLAKLSGRTMVTREGTTLGTVSYMSPEQARGQKTDNRSDIWSLGVVLYEMISGELPFRGDYEQAVIYAILNEDPLPLTAVRTGLPQAIDGVIAKALAKDPKIRYQHVDELPADLAAIQANVDQSSRTAIRTAPCRQALLPPKVHGA